MSFKLLTYVRHKEQGIEGLVISPSNQKSSHVTIYDPNCPNDNDYEEESYGSGSALEFYGYELEQIETPSIELINKCKDVIKLFKEVTK
tara:strand:+ start:60 stop:326 length:267 start_codon:yes stop_codon:yes gene_type:complete